MLSCAALLGSLVAHAQSPAQAAKRAQDAPTLRAIAVLEWTGDDEAHPKKSRLVPISIYNGDTLEDAGLYLARPEPISISSEVEYQLKQNGKTVGLFDVKNAGQEQGSWVGYGEWKPAPAPKQPAYAAVSKEDENNEDDDKPVLHRKHHDDDSNTSGNSGSKPGNDSDRPQLHKKDDSGNSSSGSDSDRPTLHRKDDSSDNSTSTTSTTSKPADDSDRPVMKKPKAKSQDDDTAHVSSLPQISDPDRPRLQRGKDNSQSLQVLPSLMGMPADLHQTVGVSDAKDRPDHPWTYNWSNPADEARMKSLLEDQARLVLGLTTPQPATPAPTHHTTTTTRKTTQSKASQAKPAPAPEPVPLEGEQFRVFELAYGSGATFVFSAHTTNPDPKQQKYVTLIAQPDLYGNLAILHKNVTDGAHLDETPRMILIDAVEAMTDNRGELLFELRGATQRQFALYRVLRGTAEQIFQTNTTDIGTLVAQ